MCACWATCTGLLEEQGLRIHLYPWLAGAPAACRELSSRTAVYKGFCSSVLIKTRRLVFKADAIMPSFMHVYSTCKSHLKTIKGTMLSLLYLGALKRMLKKAYAEGSPTAFNRFNPLGSMPKFNLDIQRCPS